MNNWYKKAILKDKRPKESNQYVYLYHVSPNKLSRFSPKSDFYGYKGIYVSPSYRSIINDWMAYVKNKKHLNHPLEQKLIEIHHKMQMLDDKDEKYQEKLKMLMKERDDIKDDSIKNVQEIQYKTVYIHKIRCPIEVYNEIVNIFRDVAKKSYDIEGDVNFGFWGWGDQLFVPDYLLNQLEIVSVETIGKNEYNEKCKQHQRKPHYITPSKENEEKYGIKFGKEDT